MSLSVEAINLGEVSLDEYPYTLGREGVGKYMANFIRCCNLEETVGTLPSLVNYPKLSEEEAEIVPVGKTMSLVAYLLSKLPYNNDFDIYRRFLAVTKVYVNSDGSSSITVDCREFVRGQYHEFFPAKLDAYELFCALDRLNPMYLVIDDRVHYFDTHHHNHFILDIKINYMKYNLRHVMSRGLVFIGIDRTGITLYSGGTTRLSDYVTSSVQVIFILNGTKVVDILHYGKLSMEGFEDHLKRHYIDLIWQIVHYKEIENYCHGREKLLDIMVKEVMAPGKKKGYRNGIMLNCGTNLVFKKGTTYKSCQWSIMTRSDRRGVMLLKGKQVEMVDSDADFKNATRALHLLPYIKEFIKLRMFMKKIYSCITHGLMTTCDLRKYGGECYLMPRHLGIWAVLLCYLHNNYSMSGSGPTWKIVREQSTFPLDYRRYGEVEMLIYGKRVEILNKMVGEIEGVVKGLGFGALEYNFQEVVPRVLVATESSDIVLVE